ncbi:myb-like protein AA [Vespula squamosa]|uniref:Myb-like protein AA n=1 Tax=Vespula squamosa TaxID=30214 RepID=A0ABD2BGM4_VESSQ
MKLWTILYLFFVVANGEKKINLEDIERDNLKAESRSKSDETKYSLKPEINQQHYSTSTYVTPQPVLNIPPEEYRQSNKYSSNEIIYQSSGQPLQQYTEYQQQTGIASKNVPTIYNSQQSIYQPEINVGNQVQSFQQKAVTHKFIKSPNKENFYIDIPMGHFLSYYPHIDLSNLNAGKVQPSFQELTQAQQISIPFYTPLLSQKQLITPVKMTYQILPQYTLRQPIPVSTTLFPKFSKGPIYASITSKKAIAPVYEQPEQSYTQGKQLLYTQAYITQSHPQQQQQQQSPPPQQQQQQQQQHVSPVIYNQGNTLYTQTTPIQTDLYVRSPVYVQDNSLHGQINQYSGQTEQSYLSSASEQQLPKQILRQEESQSVSQNYVKVPDEPNTDFVPPQIPHQTFKPDVTQLIQVSSEPEESPQVKEHVVSSEPRSLLDTYIPSNLIAAQDSSRYRERPLHLESGFLPTKTNFVQYKKRKTQ